MSSVAVVYLEVIHFTQNASSSALTVDEFAPLLKRWACCSYIGCQAPSIRHALNVPEDLHGPVVDEMCLRVARVRDCRVLIHP